MQPIVISVHVVFLFSKLIVVLLVKANSGPCLLITITSAIITIEKHSDVTKYLSKKQSKVKHKGNSND